MDSFEWAKGSVLGREHQRVGKNNQDAVILRATSDYIVGVVADGCGSQKHSEVGAWIGVELLSEAISSHFPELFTTKSWASLGEKLMEQLSIIPSPQDYCLFTILGFVVTKEITFIFGCGDGLYVLNGEVKQFSFENNAPPYLIYPDTQLQQYECMPTAQLNSLLIATDGLEEWRQTKEISDFWEQDKYFKNSDQVRRSLAIAQKKESLLKDDTTLITVRRAEMEV